MKEVAGRKASASQGDRGRRMAGDAQGPLLLSPWTSYCTGSTSMTFCLTLLVLQ